MARMHDKLSQALTPSDLAIRDDSHLHIGHAGARDGRGHFSVTICAADFAGQNTVTRHRMVYAALDDMMQTDIHALQINASEPD
ncbi:MAG TPA: BolA family protein [Gammaproteobacteria bacterium]|nr:BolA family protein [Gammaproteobacteria bacterium]